MELKSMKVTKKDKGAETKLSEPSSPAYPYGLSLYLDNESMQKLGIKSLPEIGKVMTLMARVEVTDLSENASKGDKEPRRTMTLQITDMALESEAKKKPDGEVFYK